MASDAAVAAALTAELAKKTSTSWVRYGGATHAVWHAWVASGVASGAASGAASGVANGAANGAASAAGGTLYLVSGGDEQPLPGIDDLPEPGRVEVTMRSKESGGRLLTWVAHASVVRPEDEDWAAATAALVAGRLNLVDPATAAEGWARTSTVSRLEPTGELVEEPGSLSDDAHRAEPAPTAATTRGPLPRVLHRRVRRRPRLS